jgi:hypothetical protein
MSWWRKHWRLGLALIIGGLGLAVVVILLIVRKSQEAEKLKSELLLMKTTLKVEGLEADKKARRKKLEANKEEAEALDKEILEAKKEAVAVVKEVDGLTDEQVLEEFQNLGY